MKHHSQAGTKSKQKSRSKVRHNFIMCCSKNNVKNVIAVNAFVGKRLYFSRMAVFNRNLFSVLFFLRALLIVCSAGALDPQGEFTERETVRSSQCSWCLAAQAGERERWGNGR